MSNINIVDVGIPPDDISDDWTTTLVRFHGFANLPTRKNNGNKVISPEFSCFGHQWVSKLCPGGKVNSKEGYVAVSIVNRSNTIDL